MKKLPLSRMKLPDASIADAAKIDGEDNAGAFKAPDRKPTNVFMLNPPSRSTRVAEIGVDVRLIE